MSIQPASPGRPTGPHARRRAALIYQHESLGADRAITDAIDRHVQAEQTNDEGDDGETGALAPVG